ncbi:serine hydrolase domain-containing protein [Streptomyces sp. NPDC052040]|uniref:serine hydrolase domain-containing protein n=1 Tax=unclassified Streptomyces TaxID=2593676 RepID=UPI0037D1A21E
MARVRGRLRKGVAIVAAFGALGLPLAAGAVWGAMREAEQGEPAAVTVTIGVPRLPGSVSPRPEDVPSLGPDVQRRLDAAVQGIMRVAHVPGVTVGLWTPGKGSYVRSFGVADRSSHRPMTPDLLMRIGSETKTFTVTALLRLVDRGKAGLDDPVSKYVDGVPGGSRITLRQLAGMRSGLFNYSEDPAFLKALTSDPHHSFTPRDLLGYAFKHRPLFPPGRQFDYSNTNLILLGLVVEKAGGQPLGEFIQKNVIHPARLGHTSFPTEAAFPGPHAEGYTEQTASGKAGTATDWNPSWAWAAGAMISDLGDLRSWARTVATGILPDGTALVSPALQQQRLIGSPTSVAGAGYGLGIFEVQGWIGHNGSLPGYESLAVFLPPARTTLVVLLNSDVRKDGQEPSSLLGEAITRIVTPDHVFSLPEQPAAG